MSRHPRSDRPAPPEEMLAAQLIAQRRTNDGRLGLARQGYYAAAHWNGYGFIAPGRPDPYPIGGRKQPTSVEGLAGWIVWHAEEGEMWG